MPEFEVIVSSSLKTRIFAINLTRALRLAKIIYSNDGIEVRSLSPKYNEEERVYCSKS